MNALLVTIDSDMEMTARQMLWNAQPGGHLKGVHRMPPTQNNPGGLGGQALADDAYVNFSPDVKEFMAVVAQVTAKVLAKRLAIEPRMDLEK